jgi:transposase
MDWIERAKERDRGRAVVTVEMNLRFHKMGGRGEILHNAGPRYE